MKVVVGLGVTGLSCIDYLLAQGESVVVMDTRSNPPDYQAFKEKYPQLPCFLGKLDVPHLLQASEVILSPGVSPGLPEFLDCAAHRIPLIGDVELFARAATKPIYAVTGSNGKTTVTTLLGKMAEAAGLNMAVAGNIGIPVLSCLAKEAELDGYILELSSFQLDTTESLRTKAAVVLNVSPDHLERYHHDFSAYLAAKQRIYRHCEKPVANFDQTEIWRYLSLPAGSLTFALKPPANYSLQSLDAETFLTAYDKPVLSVKEMRLQGEHQWQNALAALAMGEAMGIKLETRLSVLRDFPGLEHRCQWVRKVNEVDWYNDSKGTNIGATEAAINSIASTTSGRLILLAGGLAKGVDFTTLRACIKDHVSEVIVFGQDKAQLQQAWQDVVTVNASESLQQAVDFAQQAAQAGDSVLLSPACASFDMFANFEDRGQQFMKLVHAL